MKKLSWLWEFSKKVVLMCTVIYFTVQIFSMVAMIHASDYTYLGTLIEQSTDIMRTCVFGYMIKAGVENAFKISGSTNSENNDEGGDLNEH